MSLIEYQEKSIESSAEITLKVQMTGTPRKGTIILANGLGGRFITWSRLVSYFAHDYRFIAWDYRGFYGSSVPCDPSQLDFSYHVRDLKRILESEGIEQAIIAGWSMGVEVALEFYRHYEKCCSALFLVNGTYGTSAGPWDAFPYAHCVFSVADGILKVADRLLRPVIGALVQIPHFVQAPIALGFMGPSVDQEVIDAFKPDFGRLNLRSAAIMTDFAMEHEMEDIFPSITIPTLIVASEKDRVAPLVNVREIQQKIKDSELLVVPQGSHYSPLEYSELINLRLEKFLREHSL